MKLLVTTGLASLLLITAPIALATPSKQNAVLASYEHQVTQARLAYQRVYNYDITTYNRYKQARTTLYGSLPTITLKQYLRQYRPWLYSLLLYRERILKIYEQNYNNAKATYEHNQ